MILLKGSYVHREFLWGHFLQDSVMWTQINIQGGFTYVKQKN